MSADVIKFPVSGSAPIPPNDVLNGAVDQLDEVLIMGWRPDGTLYVNCSTTNRGELFFLIESTKQFLLEVL